MVCPLVAVLQWRQEIERFTAPGTLKACAGSLAPKIRTAVDHGRAIMLQVTLLFWKIPWRPSETLWRVIRPSRQTPTSRETHSVQVVVFHGAKRAAEAAEMADADVVLTTYAIVEGEHRRYCQPMRVPCAYCRKKFTPERLEVHLRRALGHCYTPSHSFRPNPQHRQYDPVACINIWPA